jgi:hypothetical protein
VARIAASLEVSHFYRGLRHVMTSVGLLPRPVTVANVLELEPRVDENSYRRNLSEIVGAAGRLGIPVLFVLLRDDPMQADHLKRGIGSLARRDYETAIAHLNVAVRSRGMFSELARVYLAKAYEATGDKVKATEAAIAPSIYSSFSGGTLIRLDTDYNDIMRQVAAEKNVALVDAAQALEDHPSYFIDFCHFDADGHRLLGQLLADRIAEILSRRSSGKPVPAPRDIKVAAAANPI